MSFQLLLQDNPQKEATDFKKFLEGLHAQFQRTIENQYVDIDLKFHGPVVGEENSEMASMTFIEKEPLGSHSRGVTSEKGKQSAPYLPTLNFEFIPINNGLATTYLLKTRSENVTGGKSYTSWYDSVAEYDSVLGSTIENGKVLLADRMSANEFLKKLRTFSNHHSFASINRHFLNTLKEKLGNANSEIAKNEKGDFLKLKGGKVSIKLNAEYPFYNSYTINVIDEQSANKDVLISERVPNDVSPSDYVNSNEDGCGYCRFLQWGEMAIKHPELDGKEILYALNIARLFGGNEVNNSNSLEINKKADGRLLFTSKYNNGIGGNADGDVVEGKYAVSISVESHKTNLKFWIDGEDVSNVTKSYAFPDVIKLRGNSDKEAVFSHLDDILEQVKTTIRNHKDYLAIKQDGMRKVSDFDTYLKEEGKVAKEALFYQLQIDLRTIYNVTKEDNGYIKVGNVLLDVAVDEKSGQLVIEMRDMVSSNYPYPLYGKDGKAHLTEASGLKDTQLGDRTNTIPFGKPFAKMMLDVTPSSFGDHQDDVVAVLKAIEANVNKDGGLNNNVDNKADNVHLIRDNYIHQNGGHGYFQNANIDNILWNNCSLKDAIRDIAEVVIKHNAQLNIAQAINALSTQLEASGRVLNVTNVIESIGYSDNVHAPLYQRDESLNKDGLVDELSVAGVLQPISLKTKHTLNLGGGTKGTQYTHFEFALNPDGSKEINSDTRYFVVSFANKYFSPSSCSRSECKNYDLSNIAEFTQYQPYKNSNNTNMAKLLQRAEVSANIKNNGFNAEKSMGSMVSSVKEAFKRALPKIDEDGKAHDENGVSIKNILKRTISRIF